MTFREDLAQRLQEDPEFRAIWEAKAPRRRHVHRMIRKSLYCKATKKQKRRL